MFKKTLLALAITGFAGVASAATINDGGASVKISQEGSVNEAMFTLAPVVVRAGIANGYSVGDKLVFTFTNDKFDISTAATLVEAQKDGAVAGDSTPDLTFSGPAYSDGNTVTFTVTAQTVAMAVGDKLTLGGIKLEKANLLAGGKVNVDFKVISSVNNSDYEAKSATIVEVANQIESKVTTKFDAVVDVNAERKLFVEANSTKVLDILTVETTDDAAVTLGADVNKVSYTVYGDFSFVDTNNDGTADYAMTVTNATDEAFAKDFQSITFSHTAGASHDVSVTATATATPTLIPVQTFTVDATVSYDPETENTGGTDSTEKVSGLDAGEWKLNGASGSIAFLPFGSEYARSVTVSNTSTLEGEVTIDLIAGNKTYTKTIATKAAAQSVTNISADINAFAAESGITGNASVKVVVNAPDTSVSVTGVYYHIKDGDRILVPTK
ncbi:hypothetical protein BGP78_10960 [Pseudoalteromonas sp. MSK9-3]|uniref:hypothetical protein n=1 Tax=Pseudoalteromonas sp. MSK9-3 TaxID=1897633 RepID=UPI000E6D3FC0|nr:hypothetical protein [Pseudoalteromonas sp. MSK9-3]RJE76914.1 hypothetical protein BGP78_10960 [Pseudoalteromonas sp. MSK9-3]